jgi:hypothetical protein
MHQSAVPRRARSSRRRAAQCWKAAQGNGDAESGLASLAQRACEVAVLFHCAWEVAVVWLVAIIRWICAAQCRFHGVARRSHTGSSQDPPPPRRSLPPPLPRRTGPGRRGIKESPPPPHRAATPLPHRTAQGGFGPPPPPTGAHRVGGFVSIAVVLAFPQPAMSLGFLVTARMEAPVCCNDASLKDFVSKVVVQRTYGLNVTSGSA